MPGSTLPVIPVRARRGWPGSAWMEPGRRGIFGTELTQTRAGLRASLPGMRMTYAEAEALAAELDLDVDDVAICHACLSLVSFALDSGDEHEVACSIRRIASDLWAEGLELPVRMALERAGKR